MTYTDTEMRDASIQTMMPSTAKAKSAARTRASRYVPDATPRILRALNDPQYDFRTVASIARETLVPETQVRQILHTNPREVRISPLTGPHGETLYAHRSRRITWKERLATARAYIAKST